MTTTTGHFVNEYGGLPMQVISNYSSPKSSSADISKHISSLETRINMERRQLESSEAKLVALRSDYDIAVHRESAEAAAKLEAERKLIENREEKKRKHAKEIEDHCRTHFNSPLGKLQTQFATENGGKWEYKGRHRFAYSGKGSWIIYLTTRIRPEYQPKNHTYVEEESRLFQLENAYSVQIQDDARKAEADRQQQLKRAEENRIAQETALRLNENHQRLRQYINTFVPSIVTLFQEKTGVPRELTTCVLSHLNIGVNGTKDTLSAFKYINQYARENDIPYDHAVIVLTEHAVSCRDDVEKTGYANIISNLRLREIFANNNLYIDAFMKCLHKNNVINISISPPPSTSTYHTPYHVLYPFYKTNNMTYETIIDLIVSHINV